MSAAMRIEKRGLEEYLVGGPVEVNNCDATRDGETCNVHFNGQHISTSRPDADGAEYILARWPIVPASPANAQRSAEEIAREMVSDRRGDLAKVLGIEVRISAIDHAEMRPRMAMLIEQSRAEGNAAAQPEQPRDLARRVRALVQEYAGRWVDSFRHETSALRESMSLMRDVVQSGAHAESVTMLVDQLRTKDDFPERRLIFRRAADDLERILREHEAQQ